MTNNPSDLVDMLHIFAETANETKGAAFTLTRTKAREWTIYFPALWNKDTKKGIKFVSDDLYTAIMEAEEYLKERRRPIKEQVLKYEI